MAKRVIMRAELTPQAKIGLEKICAARGMTQLSVMSRLILWFARQEGRVQHAVLGNIDEDASKLLLEDLIKRLQKAAKDADI
ncbi:MAG: hypothetical protein NZ561_03155 [Phycisphaerae bacterium]|nr:hypothetical protein [Phycisphaerae bacterium]